MAGIGGFAFHMASRGIVPFGIHVSKFRPLAWYKALVLSVTSFHGRGFLLFSDLGDPVTILAANEAVFGLFVEVSFSATFTRRRLANSIRLLLALRALAGRGRLLAAP